MDWLYLSLLSAACFTSFSILIKQSLQKSSNTTAFTILNNLTTGFILFAFVPFFPVHISITPMSILLIVIASMLFAFSSLFFTKGRLTEEVGVVSVVRQTSVFWIFIGGYIFFNEPMTVSKLFGTILLFYGTWIALWGKGKFNITKGVYYVFISAVALSFSSLIAKDIVDVALPPVLYSATLFILADIWLLLFMKERRHVLHEFKIQKLHMPFISLFLAVSIASLYTAYQSGEISRIFPVYNSYVIMSVVAGVIFLHEKAHIHRKLLGSSIALLGVILIVLR
jgi:drug/metabolite transporter (DMT)-like permease